VIDIQNSQDHRDVELEQVGVRDIRYPIVVLDKARGRQTTIANLSLSVNLPKHFKGTHMSRFVELLEKHKGEFTLHTLPALLGDLRSRLNADSARVEASFPYFLERKAPVTEHSALLDFQCSFRAESRGAVQSFELEVTVPVTSLCPCSKAISDYGAHNQRGYVTIRVRPTFGSDSCPQIIWLEELIEVAESSGSSRIYPLLKRPDERHVTMEAYDNPVFVEDVVRNVAVQLRQHPLVDYFWVEVVNHESIHNHSAYAATSWNRCSSTVEPSLELAGSGSS